MTCPCSWFELTQAERNAVIDRLDYLAENLPQRIIENGGNFTGNIIDYLLVGSMARGTANKWSDLDVMLVCDKQTPISMENHDLKNAIKRMFGWFEIQRHEDLQRPINYIGTIHPLQVFADEELGPSGYYAISLKLGEGCFSNQEQLVDYYSEYI